MKVRSCTIERIHRTFLTAVHDWKRIESHNFQNYLFQNGMNHLLLLKQNTLAMSMLCNVEFFAKHLLSFENHIQRLYTFRCLDVARVIERYSTLEFVVQNNTNFTEHFIIAKFFNTAGVYQIAVHMLQILHRCVDYKPKNDEYIEMVVELSLAWSNCNQPEKARELLLDFLHEHSELVETTTDEGLAKIYNSLGVVLRHLRQYPEALQQYEYALTHLRTIDQKDTNLYLFIQHNCAIIHDRVKNYEEAKQIYEELRPTFEEKFGESSFQYLVLLENLSLVYKRLSQIHLSEKLLRMIMTTRQRLLGEEHKLFISVLYNLALCLIDQEKFEEADILLEQGIVICQRTPHFTVKDTMDFQRLKVTMLRRQQKFTQSEMLLLEVVKNSEEHYGECSQVTVDIIKIFLFLYKDKKEENIEKWLWVHTTLFQRRSVLFGESHSKTLLALKSLSWFILEHPESNLDGIPYFKALVAHRESTKNWKYYRDYFGLQFLIARKFNDRSILEEAFQEVKLHLEESHHFLGIAQKYVDTFNS